MCASRYRRCPSWLSTLLSWLSLLKLALFVEQGFDYLNHTKSNLGTLARNHSIAPPPSSRLFCFSFFFLTSTQTNLMRSSLEIQTDKPGTQGLRGRCATFSDGARVSTDGVPYLQSPSHPHPLTNQNQSKRRSRRRGKNGASPSPG